MKIAIIGAAGVRTPLILQSIIARQEKLGLHELALMDIDGERLEIIGALSHPIEQSPETKFRILRTTDSRLALKDADFVITTFRVGGMESRVIDERVPLRHGLLGQETTGAGGFAMGIRSVPVLLDYVNQMGELCPKAWLINFANPAGMLTEAVVRQAGWRKVVGICDGPASMQLVIAALLHEKSEDVYLDYFGLNHLGWINHILVNNRDYLPDILESIKSTGKVTGLPFDAEFITSLGMIPNEYLYYYYYASQAVNNIISAEESRGEQIVNLNLRLLAMLKDKYTAHDLSGMQEIYQAYLNERGGTYMVKETGKAHDLSIIEQAISASAIDEGYAGVALNLIEGLIGNKPTVQILNVPNSGAIPAMEENDVIEIPVLVRQNHLHPLAVGSIPEHCLGLMKLVKNYERLTIEAATERSYQKARLALTVHPLINDFSLATIILNDYISLHKGYFPDLK
jgi:6-phospho-beta-glucosidase